jgi:ribosomal-protein-alanine N-acetyltransferase
MGDVRLTTPRLVLRRMTMADAPTLHEAMSDPETMRYWSTLPHRSLAETEAWVAETMEAVASGEADDFVVTRDGAVIGKAGLWRRGELGILIARSHWRQGLAAEALGAVIDRAFGAGMPRIEADVDPRNHASLALLTHLGFRKSGEAKATFRLGEEWVDSVYLTLTPEPSSPAQFDGG